MKNIQKTSEKIQNFYASRFFSAILMIGAVEILVLFLAIFGGAK